MNKIMGGKLVDMQTVRRVPIPTETATYKPVPYEGIVNLTKERVENAGAGLAIESERYILAKGGDRFFGLLTYRNSDTVQGISFGIIGSYDKSLPNKVCGGSTVFICTNLMVLADIYYMRKHTPNVWSDLTDGIDRLIDTTVGKYSLYLGNTRERLRALELSDDRAFGSLGQLYGRGILTTPQLKIAADEWRAPRHDIFRARNAWSLYNCCNQALKRCNLMYAMERHRDLHLYFVGYIEKESG